MNLMYTYIEIELVFSLFIVYYIPPCHYYANQYECLCLFYQATGYQYQCLFNGIFMLNLLLIASFVSSSARLILTFLLVLLLIRNRPFCGFCCDVTFLSILLMVLSRGCSTCSIFCSRRTSICKCLRLSLCCVSSKTMMLVPHFGKLCFGLNPCPKESLGFCLF